MEDQFTYEEGVVGTVHSVTEVADGWELEFRMELPPHVGLYAFKETFVDDHPEVGTTIEIPDQIKTWLLESAGQCPHCQAVQVAEDIVTVAQLEEE